MLAYTSLPRGLLHPSQPHPDPCILHCMHIKLRSETYPMLQCNGFKMT